MILQVPSVLFLLLNVGLSRSVIASTRRVYNGEEIQDDIRSFLVKLELRRHDRLYSSLCSGSIISRSWVITAAHCTNKIYQIIYVVDGTEASRRLIAKANMEDTVRHPSFIPKNAEHDIALVLLKQAIVFYAEKKPIKFAAIRPEFGSTAIIAEYGATEEGLTLPRQGNVTITQCPNDTLSNNICSQGPVRAGDGDSGGPLIFKGVLIGVIKGSCRDVETNIMCGNVYASIASNIDWIKNVTKIQEN